MYNPSVIEQSKFNKNGINGDYIISYDINRNKSPGYIQ